MEHGDFAKYAADIEKTSARVLAPLWGKFMDKAAPAISRRMPFMHKPMMAVDSGVSRVMSADANVSRKIGLLPKAKSKVTETAMSAGDLPPHIRKAMGR